MTEKTFSLLGRQHKLYKLGVDVPIKFKIFFDAIESYTNHLDMHHINSQNVFFYGEEAVFSVYETDADTFYTTPCPARVSGIFIHKVKVWEIALSKPLYDIIYSFEESVAKDTLVYLLNTHNFLKDYQFSTEMVEMESFTHPKLIL